MRQPSAELRRLRGAVRERADLMASARVVAALEALEIGDQAEAVAVLLDLEADLVEIEWDRSRER